MVEKLCESQRASPRAGWSQKPGNLGSNQCVEIGGVGLSWSVLLKRRQLSLLFWRSLMWTMPHAKEPIEDLHIVDLHEARKVTLTVALKASMSMSMVRQIVYQWKFSVVAYCLAWSSCKDGCKSAEQKISWGSTEVSAHTLFEKSTSKTFKKNGVSRWTPQRKPQKKTLLNVWSLQKCIITAITNGTIHSHVHWDITINTSNEAQLRRDVPTGHSEDVKQKKCFNKREYGVAQSPDLEMLWPGVWSAKYSSPEKMNEPKRFCKAERSKIPPDRGAGLIWLRSALPKQS